MKKIFTLLFIAALGLSSCKKDEITFDGPTQVQFDKSSYAYAYAPGAATLPMTVQLISAAQLDNDVVVTLNVVAGKTTSGGYTVPASVTIPAGEYSATFNVSFAQNTKKGNLVIELGAEGLVIPPGLSKATVAVTVANGWDAVGKSATFSTLESSQVKDTLAFPLKKGYWSNANAVDITVGYTVGDKTVAERTTDTTWVTAQLVAAAGAKVFPFTIQDLQTARPLLGANDTVKMFALAKADGRTDKVTYNFVITEDKYAKPVSYNFTNINIISTADTLGLTKADSAKSYYSLLDNKAIVGTKAAIAAYKTKPMLLLLPNFSINTFIGDTCKVEYQPSTKDAYTKANRVVCESTWVDAGATTSITPSASDNYYQVKITVGVNKGAKAAYYYGYIKVKEVPLTGTSFAITYGPKRNYKKQ